MNTGLIIVIDFILYNMKLDINLVNDWRFETDLYLSSFVHPDLFRFLKFFQNLSMHHINSEVKT